MKNKFDRLFLFSLSLLLVISISGIFLIRSENEVLIKKIELKEKDLLLYHQKNLSSGGASFIDPVTN